MLRINDAIALQDWEITETFSHNEAGGMLLSFGFTFLTLDVIQSAAKVFRVSLQ